jgi:hypothetical protein
LLALVIAFCWLTGAALANQLLATRLTLDMGEIPMIAFLVILPVLVIFISGAYPGWCWRDLSRSGPSKEKYPSSKWVVFPLRRSLVISQFAICQVLVIGTL